MGAFLFALMILPSAALHAYAFYHTFKYGCCPLGPMIPPLTYTELRVRP